MKKCELRRMLQTYHTTLYYYQHIFYYLAHCVRYSTRASVSAYLQQSESSKLLTAIARVFMSSLFQSRYSSLTENQKGIYQKLCLFALFISVNWAEFLKRQLFIVFAFVSFVFPRFCTNAYVHIGDQLQSKCIFLYGALRNLHAVRVS